MFCDQRQDLRAKREPFLFADAPDAQQVLRAARALEAKLIQRTIPEKRVGRNPHLTRFPGAPGTQRLTQLRMIWHEMSGSRQRRDYRLSAGCPRWGRLPRTQMRDGSIMHDFAARFG